MVWYSMGGMGEGFGWGGAVKGVTGGQAWYGGKRGHSTQSALGSKGPSCQQRAKRARVGEAEKQRAELEN